MIGKICFLSLLTVSCLNFANSSCQQMDNNTMQSMDDSLLKGCGCKPSKCTEPELPERCPCNKPPKTIDSLENQDRCACSQPPKKDLDMMLAEISNNVEMRMFYENLTPQAKDDFVSLVSVLALTVAKHNGNNDCMEINQAILRAIATKICKPSLMMCQK